MNILIFIPIFLFLLLTFSFAFWFGKDRRYKSGSTVASAYDDWTNDQLLERMWGEHVHLGYYYNSTRKTDFRLAKVNFVHELVRWSGLDQLPKGSRILDVGCGIGGSARILAKEYGFDVTGISISPAQIKRAKELTSKSIKCNFEIMDALDLKIPQESFDGVWSVEAGPHMPDKQRYADEMLRVLKPGGLIAIADWNSCYETDQPKSYMERLIMKQLLNQWAHPEFSTINGFKENLLNSRFSRGVIEVADWTQFTIPSWNESILEGFRRPVDILSLGLITSLKGFREIPTILMMRWAFANGLMEFGVFRIRS